MTPLRHLKLTPPAQALRPTLGVSKAAGALSACLFGLAVLKLWYLQQGISITWDLIRNVDPQALC